MTAPQIDRDDDNGGGTPWRWLGLIGAILAAFFMVAVCAGFATAAWEDGFDLVSGVILALLLLTTIGLAMLAVRLGRRQFGSGAKVPARERKSLQLLLASFVLGLFMALILVIASPTGVESASLSILSNDPIDPVVALIMCAIILFVIPYGSWQWHRAVDEHERDAYRMGAVAAAYVYMLGAPLWWFLWRGGFVPAPNGIILYDAFCLSFAAVWLWKKYR